MDTAPDAVTGTSSFADQVRGQESEPIDMVMAKLMADLYDDHYGRTRQPDIDGWTQVGDAELLSKGIDPAKLSDVASGFRSLIYGDGQGHYILAYSGTDEAKDWLTNFRQGLGIRDQQYDEAIALAQQVHQAFGDNVVLTGHSLGGGLAGAAAEVTGVPAVTFNAAGVANRTVERYGLDADAARELAQGGLVRRYTVRNEILTDLQEKNVLMRGLMPDAVGYKIELPESDPLSFWQKLNPVKDIKHDVDLHYIDSVIKGFEAKYGADYDHSARLQSGAPMVDQALDGLQRLGPGTGLSNPQDLRTATLALAAEGARQGLSRIDSVLPATDGSGYFLVQGGASDPAHKRVFVEASQLLAQPAEQRAEQLAQATATRQPTPVEAQPSPQRAALA